MHLSLVRGGRMASNKDLNKANKAKKDEFYTMLADIEVELKHYRKHFKGKTVLCNCDDPFESNFFKYFVSLSSVKTTRENFPCKILSYTSSAPKSSKTLCKLEDCSSQHTAPFFIQIKRAFPSSAEII